MEVTSDLRPVEALYLLDFFGRELMYDERSLAAALAYLGSEGYIIPRREDFILTEKGRQGDPNLRIYEREILDSIAEDYPEGLIEAINYHDFRQDMAMRGFFRTQKQESGWWIFKQVDTDYLPTEQFNEAIKELDDLRCQIYTAQAKGGKLDRNLVSMAYAFPSLAFSDGFKKYVSKVLEEVDIAQIAARSAAMAAIYVTAISPNIANTTVSNSH